MFKDLKKDINKSLNGVYKNTNKQQDEVMKTVQDIKVKQNHQRNPN